MTGTMKKSSNKIRFFAPVLFFALALSVALGGLLPGMPGNGVFRSAYAASKVSADVTEAEDENPKAAFKLIFRSENGDENIVKNVFYGEAVSDYFPKGLAKQDYRFVRWEGYTDGMVVSGDHEFTAIWEQIAEEGIDYSEWLTWAAGGVIAGMVAGLFYFIVKGKRTF